MDTRHALSPSIPNELASHLLWLPDPSRNMGIHIMAGKGSGKSRLMGRIIAWLDFLRGIPLVVFDPMGTTIDNFLDKLTRLPKDVQERLWSRVLYVDASGKTGTVIPLPLYYRFGDESLYEVSQRYLDVLRKLDPNLQTASIEGWNPLWRIGTAAGMILAALGYQITEAEDLVRDPSAWDYRIRSAVEQYPEAGAARSFFQDWTDLKDDVRSRRSESFLNKVALFTFDPAMRAMFGPSQAGIHWPHVMDRRMAVLFDFRGEQDIERRRFKMVWAFNYLLTFIKHRGAGRHRPLSVIVDELSALFSPSVLAADFFAAELDELINVIARNCMVWLTIAHQELFQVSERAQKTLMAMGTQMLGVTSDRDAAIALARQFFRYDPYWVKKREPVYASAYGVSQVIDYRSVEFAVEEQELLRSYAFTEQGRFRFLARTARGEGDTTGGLRPVTIAHFDQDRYTDEALVAEARRRLMEKRGRPVADIQSEIASRLTRCDPVAIASKSAPQIPRLSAGISATMDPDEQPDDLIFGEKQTASESQKSRTR